MQKSKWIWMPHAGHFICGKDCEFHLNTYVGKYIVSTVGELWPEKVVREIHAEVHDKKWWEENKQKLGDNFNYAYMKKFGFMEIGWGRLYETMVFRAKKSDHVCCPWRMISGEDLEANSYNKPEEAFKGHYAMCEKWSKK